VLRLQGCSIVRGMILKMACGTTRNLLMSCASARVAFSAKQLILQQFPLDKSLRQLGKVRPPFHAKPLLKQDTTGCMILRTLLCLANASGNFHFSRTHNAVPLKIISYGGFRQEHSNHLPLHELVKPPRASHGSVLFRMYSASG
jgi:hypothetical protein